MPQKVIKPSNPFYECLLGFCLTTFSAPPQILAASTVSSAQFRNEEMMGDRFHFGATAAGLF